MEASNCNDSNPTTSRVLLGDIAQTTKTCDTKNVVGSPLIWLFRFVRSNRPRPILPDFSATHKENQLKNIFVGNLSFGATEDSVRSLFESYGSVSRVSIVTDRDTGQPRGFGFVEMDNPAEADQAIGSLNGYALDGRALNVNEARPKTERPSGGNAFGRQRRNRY